MTPTLLVWVVSAAVAALAALWMARPFLRSGVIEMSEGDRAISIYRDQLDELEREAAVGLIGAGAHESARREIEMRAARAARLMGEAPSVSRRHWGLAGATLAAVVAGAVGLYSVLGTPQMPDQPLAARTEAALVRLAEAGDPRARATLLEREIAETPDVLDLWWRLAQLRREAGDHAASVDAYRRAAELSDEAPGVLAAYAEALTLANGNKVPAQARVVFTQILIDNPTDARARYYLALAKAQDKAFDEALADWLALYRESPPGAPWLDVVRRDIVNMARFTGEDLITLLPDARPAELALAATPVERPKAAAIAAAAAAPGQTEGQGASLGAVARAAEAVESAIATAQSLAEAGDVAGARTVLDDALERYAAAPVVAARLEAARRDLDGPRGPSDEQVAAAAEMSPDDRDDMIAGMVAGLAERLEAAPDDLDGWLMLIRSYAVLQDADAAIAARDRALAYFGAGSQAGRRIDRLAVEMGLGD